MNKIIYYLTNLNCNISVKIENAENNIAITKTIRCLLSKKFKIDYETFLLDCGFTLLTCNFCGGYMLPDYLLFSFNKETDKNILTINDVFYKHPEKHFCHRKECPSKKYNPNSADFISIACGISKDEALNVIHTRNKTPFYRENHISDEEYKKYQTRDKDWYINNNKNYEEILKNSVYHRSKDFYILKYGEDIGLQKYNEIGKRKAITIENMIEIHGEKDGIEIYNHWKDSVKQSLNNFIKRYGDVEGREKYNKYLKSLKERLLNRFNVNTLKSNEYNEYKNYLLDRIKSNDFYINENQIDTTIENILKMVHQNHNKFNFYEILDKNTIINIVYNRLSYLEKYAIFSNNQTIIKQIKLCKYQEFLIKIMFNDKMYFYQELKNKTNILFSGLDTNENFIIIPCKNSIYSNYFFITKENELLRSEFELNFYIEMCKHNINKHTYYTDKKYPNQTIFEYRYDFYFPEINFYVEIAGLSGKEDYDQKMKLKKELFNPYIVYTKKDINNCIETILIKFNEKEKIL